MHLNFAGKAGFCWSLLRLSPGKAFNKALYHFFNSSMIIIEEVKIPGYHGPMVERASDWGPDLLWRLGPGARPRSSSSSQRPPVPRKPPNRTLPPAEWERMSKGGGRWEENLKIWKTVDAPKHFWSERFLPLNFPCIKASKKAPFTMLLELS